MTSSTHTYVGDLQLELISPSGRSVELRRGLGASQLDLQESYDSAAPSSPLAALVGQPMQGAWVLRVVDVVAIDVRVLNKRTLELTADA